MKIPEYAKGFETSFILGHIEGVIRKELSTMMDESSVNDFISKHYSTPSESNIEYCQCSIPYYDDDEKSCRTCGRLIKSEGEWPSPKTFAFKVDLG